MSVDAVMAELQGRVRERLRQRLLVTGASKAFEDPALFADVERLLSTATELGDANTLVLPELLGDPKRWRLETAMRYESHRGAASASFVIFVKRRILMPLVRWLFEYSRDNFERQRRVNQILFACVEELAVETAQLRQKVHRLSQPSTGAEGPDALEGHASARSARSEVLDGRPSTSSGRPEHVEGR